MKLDLDAAAERYGIQRKSIRQAARRHAQVAAAIEKTPDGPVLDTDVFDVWWNEERDARMDKVRQGLGG